MVCENNEISTTCSCFVPAKDFRKPFNAIIILKGISKTNNYYVHTIFTISNILGYSKFKNYYFHNGPLYAISLTIIYKS